MSKIEKIGEHMHKNDAEKGKALDAALAQIERAFGKGSIMKLNEDGSKGAGVEVVSTGSLGLDIGVLSKFTAQKVQVKQHWPCT